MSFWTALEEPARKAGLFPFRPPQERALKALDQGRNLLLIWPTGSGKSLCYQLPALVRPGLTVVISPLIALMEDQTAKGRALGWPVTCIHSGMAREEKEARLKAVRDGRVKLLYVTPERFRQKAFVKSLAQLSITLLAVDEAHCISQWGHDFRPDYSRVGEIREILGRPQTVALTATATEDVQKDILQQLALADADVFWEGVERPNLFLAAEECDHFDAKAERLVAWLRESPGAKIVYFTLISTLEKVAAKLSSAKFRFETYHGDMQDRARKQAQERFLTGGSQLILATPAFGLGVDKPDVRGVLHFETPGSLEAYFQEVGRAGRDGQPARCLWLFEPTDLETQMRFIDSLTPDPSYVKSVYDLLVRWRDRLNTLQLDDLRAQFSFKNRNDQRLETSLNLLDRYGVIEWPGRRLDRLTIERELQAEDLTPELWSARRKQLQMKLLSLMQWFRSEECRKVGIYKYFGWHGANQPCGFCDRCGAET